MLLLLCFCFLLPRIKFNAFQLLLNTGDFSSEDVVLFENLASHAGVVFRNAELYEQTKKNERKIFALLDVVKMIHSDPNVQSLIFTLSHRSRELVDAQLATCYMLDSGKNELVVMQGELQIRMPTNKGIAGYVATTGEILNIPDAYLDHRFNRDVDKKTGFRTQAILCMPILGQQRQVIGVLQLINKSDGGQFSEQDAQIISTLLDIAGPIFSKFSLFSQRRKPALEAVPDQINSKPEPPRTSSMESITE